MLLNVIRCHASYRAVIPLKGEKTVGSAFAKWNDKRRCKILQLVRFSLTYNWCACSVEWPQRNGIWIRRSTGISWYKFATSHLHLTKYPSRAFFFSFTYVKVTLRDRRIGRERWTCFMLAPHVALLSPPLKIAISTEITENFTDVLKLHQEFVPPKLPQISHQKPPVQMQENY